MAQRAAQRLSEQFDMTYACSKGFLQYLCSGRSAAQLVQATSVEFAKEKAEGVVMSLAESEGTVIAVCANYITPQSLNALRSDSYVVIADKTLEKAESALWCDEYARAVKQTKKQLREIWKTLRDNCDLKALGVRRYDTLCNRIKDWFKEIVQ